MAQPSTSRGRFIPHHREGGKPVAALKHVGLYVSTAPDWSGTRVQLSPTPLEQSEMLEQLRVLEHGFKIGVAVVPCKTQGIDTPEQYEAFVERWRRPPSPLGEVALDPPRRSRGQAAAIRSPRYFFSSSFSRTLSSNPQSAA